MKSLISILFLLLSFSCSHTIYDSEEAKKGRFPASLSTPDDTSVDEFIDEIENAKAQKY